MSNKLIEITKIVYTDQSVTYRKKNRKIIYAKLEIRIQLFRYWERLIQEERKKFVSYA